MSDAFGIATGTNPLFGYNQKVKERIGTMAAESKVLCAGLAAEHVFFGVALSLDNENAASDFEKINSFEREGMQIPGKRGGFVGDDAFIEKTLTIAVRHVKASQSKIKRIAEALVNRDRLSRE